jgi:DNA polymerase-3 subunit alpha (Gram-positive type)
MKRHYSELQKLTKMERQKKDDDLLETYNIIFEMYSRGIEFETIDINKSLSTDYRVNKENNTLIPPFSIIEKVGESVAEKCIQVRNNGEFVSIRDFEIRSSIPKQAIATIKALGGTRNLPEDINSSEQLNLFG